MPGYGLLGPEAGKGLLPWPWATERLTQARNYWLATVRPDGRPHVVPVWAVWLETQLLFSTGQRSRKLQNLKANPACVISIDLGEEALSLEGRAQAVTDPELLKQFTQQYGAKYNWNMDGFADPVWAVTPSMVFGFVSSEGQFTGTATRWRFE